MFMNKLSYKEQIALVYSLIKDSKKEVKEAKKKLLSYINEYRLDTSSEHDLMDLFVINPAKVDVREVLFAYFCEHELFEEPENMLVDAFLKEPTNVDVRKVLLTYIERRSLYHKSAAKLLNAVSQPSKASPKPPKAILLLY